MMMLSKRLIILSRNETFSLLKLSLSLSTLCVIIVNLIGFLNQQQLLYAKHDINVSLMLKINELKFLSEGVKAVIEMCTHIHTSRSMIRKDFTFT
jgi:hypothetical protein